MKRKPPHITNLIQPALGEHAGIATSHRLRVLGRLLANQPSFATLIKHCVFAPVPRSGDYIADGVRDVEVSARIERILLEAVRSGPTLHRDYGSRLRLLESKFKVVGAGIRGTDLVLLDEMLYTGATARAIIPMLRSFGPRSIHFAFATPPVIKKFSHPKIEGIPMAHEFHAEGRSDQKDLQEIRKSVAERLNVDGVIFLDWQRFREILAGISYQFADLECILGFQSPRNADAGQHLVSLRGTL